VRVRGRMGGKDASFGPATVRLHSDFESSLGSLEKDIYLCWIVQEISKSGEKQKRILLVSSRFLFLCELNTDICRVIRLADIRKLIIHRPPESTGDEVLVVPHLDSAEFAMLLALRNDRRNSPPRADGQDLGELLNALHDRFCGEAGPFSVEYRPSNGASLLEEAEVPLTDRRFEDVNAKRAKWQAMGSPRRGMAPPSMLVPSSPYTLPSVHKPPPPSVAASPTSVRDGALLSGVGSDQGAGDAYDSLPRTLAPPAPPTTQRTAGSAAPPVAGSAAPPGADMSAASVECTITGKPEGVDMGCVLSGEMYLQDVRNATHPFGNPCGSGGDHAGAPIPLPI